MSGPISELIGAVHAAGGSIERHGRDIKLTAAAPLPDALLARLRAAKPALIAHLQELVAEPTLLGDGRRLHRFRAYGPIPTTSANSVLPLVRHARSYGVVLVADGPQLIVVELPLSKLPPETLHDLRSAAGEIIALLRAESRARCDADRASAVIAEDC
jgi:hypothetical protein